MAGRVLGQKQLMPVPSLAHPPPARGAASAMLGRGSGAGKPNSGQMLVTLGTFRARDKDRMVGRLGRRELRKMSEDELVMYKFGIDKDELDEFRGIFQLLDKDQTGSLGTQRWCTRASSWRT